MRLALRHAHHSTTLDVPSELFGDANALQRFIAQKAGGIYTACAGMQKHLAPAILKLSGDPPRRQIYRFIGWTPIDAAWVYVSSGLSINAQGALPSPPIHFTASAISGQLKEEGVLLDSGSDAHRGVQIRVRVWRLKGDCFGGDSGDSGDSRS